MANGPLDIGGNGGNNTQQGHAGGLGGVAQDLGISSSYQENGPNAGSYGTFTGNAAANQEGYQQTGNAAQGRQAAQINNPYQDQSRGNLAGNQGEFGGLIGALNDDIANPNDSVAVHQFQHGLDQSIAAQTAMANSARGGATAQAGAQRSAQQQGAQTMAQGASTAAQIAEQDRFAAIQAAGGLNTASGNLNLGQYQTEQQRAEAQAQIDAAQKAQNDAFDIANQNLANSNQQQQLQALNDYGQLQHGASVTNAGTATNAAAGGMGLFGTALNTAGQVAGFAAGPAGAAPPVPPTAAPPVPPPAGGGLVGGYAGTPSGFNPDDVA